MVHSTRMNHWKESLIMPIEKFENWTSEQKTQFILRFKNEYNNTCNTKYELEKESLDDGQDYDFILKEEKTILKVQHTLAGAENEKEYARPKFADKVILGLKEKLEDLDGLLIILNITNPPKNDKERRRLVYNIEYLIRNKNMQTAPKIFTYSKQDEEYISVIKKYVDELEVIIDGAKGIRFMWDSNKLGEAATLGDDIRFKMAVDKKAQHYADPKDLIVLVHFHNNSVSDIFLPSILLDGKSSKFKGIWIYDEWRDKFIPIKNS